MDTEISKLILEQTQVINKLLELLIVLMDRELHPPTIVRSKE